MGLAMIAAGAAVVGTMAVGAYSLVSGNAKLQQVTQTNTILDQAAYSLTTESSESGGNMTLACTGCTANMNRVAIPTASTAPKKDAFGKNLVICTPATYPLTSNQSGVVFALLSSGPNGVMDTTCSTALTGSKTGDDGIRFKTVMDIRKGVGGTVYFGDPVADVGSLPTGMKPGEVRFVIGENKLYQYSGSSWSATTSSSSAIAAGFSFGALSEQTSGSACTTIGQLSKDSNSKVMVCGTNSSIPGADCSTIGAGVFTYTPSGDQYICAN